MKKLPLAILAATSIAALSSANAAKPEEKAEKADPKEAAASSNSFAADLYQHLKSTEGNLFFSPYSISSALGMTHSGAGGETAAQIQKVTHLADGEAGHAGNHALMESLRDAHNSNLEMNVANALWPQSGYTLLDPFLKTSATQYGAELTPVNFGNAAEAAGVINQWVEDQTKERIKDLIPPDAITPLTRLILTNAIYFKGEWTKAFNSDSTQDLPFHFDDGTSEKVPMMYQKDSFKYGEVDGLQILEMNYLSASDADPADAERIKELQKLIDEKRAFMARARMTREAYMAAMAEIKAWQDEINELKRKQGSDRLSMAILLPEAKDGIGALEEKLTNENLNKWLASTRSQKVHVTMPKFKLETSFQLANTLAEMGMPNAFDDSKADFSNMTTEKGLYISSVVHKAFVEVNEEGTEAAAATGIVLGVKSAAIKRDPRFVADHPFVFLIRDQETGCILFMGRLGDPRE